MQYRSSAAALALAGIALAALAPRSVANAQTPAQTAPATAKTKIGDPAPALALESTVAGTPVTALEKGKTYLLHFWAPWNKASVDQLTMLTDVQKRYAERGLVVVGIASTDVTGTTVEKVKETLAGQGAAVGITIGWDKGSATKDAYLKAFGRAALPCAVIVDAEGRIAFVEDAALSAQFVDAIVAGRHDLAAMAAWQTKAERAQQTFKSLETAYRAGKWAEVYAFADELLQVDPVGHGGNAIYRMQGQAKTEGADKALAWAKLWVEGAGKDSPEGQNAVAWALVDPADPFPVADLDLALKTAQRAAELTKNEDGAILDTVARVHFLKGDLAKAVETQKLALERLKPAQMRFKAQIEAALKEYEAALAKKG